MVTVPGRALGGRRRLATTRLTFSLVVQLVLLIVETLPLIAMTSP